MPRLLPLHARNEETTAALVAEFFQGYSGDWGEFDRGTVDAFRVANRIAFRTQLDLADVQRVIDAIPSELHPMPASVALLRRLKAQGHRLFFLSNMPIPYAEHLERTQPLKEWFEDGLFSSRIQMVKPEPAIFHRAAQAFGIAPGESVFIDDFALNVKAAKALGWDAIHFLSSEQCEADLVKRGLI
ncbi:HAD family phosphatase [Albitalea terrae]|uniref:HAD family phosphatase n=2 Tax=Piscinibacter terrae TaxID=2496871 RepID=A0A3N7K1L0_9BURK|nr:HAD family phosphatase [Albitalea terrae]